MSISFSGLASGLDTSSWIQSLTALKQAKVTVLQKERETVLFQKDTLSSIRSFFSSFRSTIEKITDAKFNIASMNLFAQNLATSTDLKVLTATATEEAKEGTYEIKVDKLATSTKASSRYNYLTTTIDTKTAVDESLLINLSYDNGGGREFVQEGVIGVTVNGVERSIVLKKTDTMTSFVEKLKEIGVDANYNVRTGVFTANLSASDINDYGNTGIVHALHLEGVNEGYLSNNLTYETVDPTGQTADGGTKLVDLGVNTGTITVAANSGTYNFTIGANTSMQNLLDWLHGNNITADLKDGIFTLEDAEITSDGTTGLIDAFGLGNAEIYSNSQKSNELVYNTTILESTTATLGTKLADIGDGITVTNGMNVVVKNSSNESHTIAINANSTIGDLLTGMNNAGMSAIMNPDGTIEISGGTITGGTFDAIDALGLNSEPFTAMVSGNALNETIEVYELVTLQTRLVDDMGVKEGYLSVTDAAGSQQYLKIYSGQTIADLMTDLANYGIYSDLDEETGILTITGGDFATMTDADVLAKIADGSIVETEARYKHGTDLLTALYGAASISVSQTSVSQTYARSRALTYETLHTIDASLTTTLGQLGLAANETATFNVRGETRNVAVTTDMTVQGLMDALAAEGIESSFSEEHSKITIENANITSSTAAGTLGGVLGLTTEVSGKYVTSDALYAKNTIVVEATRETTLAELGVNSNQTITFYHDNGSTQNIDVNGNTSLGTIIDTVNNFTNGTGSITIQDGVLKIENGYFTNDVFVEALGLERDITGYSHALGSLKLTVTEFANETTTLGELGCPEEDYIIVCSSADGTVLGNIKCTADMTIGGLLTAFAGWGISAEISEGQIHFNTHIFTDPPNYLTGDPGGVLDILGIETYPLDTVTVTTTTAVSQSSSIAITNTSTITATSDTKLSDIGCGGTLTTTVRGVDGVTIGYVTTTGDMTVGDLLTALAGYGISGTIENGVVKLTSDQYRFISGGVAGDTGLSIGATSTTATTTITTAVSQTSSVVVTATHAANATTKLSEIGCGGTITTDVLNTAGSTENTGKIITTGDMTVGDFIAALSGYGISASIDSSGVLTLNSTNGSYISGGLAGSSYFNITNTDSGDITLGTSQTGSTRRYNTTVVSTILYETTVTVTTGAYVPTVTITTTDADRTAYVTVTHTHTCQHVTQTSTQVTVTDSFVITEPIVGTTVVATSVEHVYSEAVTKTVTKPITGTITFSTQVVTTTTVIGETTVETEYTGKTVYQTTTVTSSVSDGTVHPSFSDRIINDEVTLDISWSETAGGTHYITVAVGSGSSINDLLSGIGQESHGSLHAGYSSATGILQITGEGDIYDVRASFQDYQSSDFKDPVSGENYTVNTYQPYNGAFNIEFFYRGDPTTTLTTTTITVTETIGGTETLDVKTTRTISTTSTVIETLPYSTQAVYTEFVSYRAVTTTIPLNVTINGSLTTAPRTITVSDTIWVPSYTITTTTHVWTTTETVNYKDKTPVVTYSSVWVDTTGTLTVTTWRTETTTSQATMTGETKLSQLGMSAATASITIISDGTTYGVTFSKTDTVDDVISSLAGLGIHAKITNLGALKITGDREAYITYMDDNLRSALGFSTSTSFTTTVDTYLQTAAAKSVTNTLTSDDRLSNFGIATPLLKVFSVEDNQEYFISLGITATVDELLTTLAGYGISGSVSGGKITLQNTGDKEAYITYISPFVAQGLKLSTALYTTSTTTTTYYTNTNGAQKTYQTVNTLTTDDTLADFGSPGAKFIIHSVEDSRDYTVTLKTTDTFADVLTKFAGYGIYGDIKDGKLTLMNTGDTEAYIKEFDDPFAIIFKMQNTAYWFTTSTSSTTYHANDTSDTLLCVSIMTNETTLSELGINDGTVEIYKDGIYHTESITTTSTIADFRELLATYNIHSEILEGKLSLNADGVVWLSAGELVTTLGLQKEKWTTGEYSQISKDLTDTQTIVNIATMGRTLAELTDNTGTELGITNGSIYVYKDGTRSLLNIDMNDTLETLASKLSTYGIEMGIDQNGRVYFQGNNDSYLTTDGLASGVASNILTKLNVSGNWSTTYDSTSQKLDYEITQDSRITGDTKMTSLQDSSGNSLNITEGEYTVVSNGVRTVETITADTTVDDFVATMAKYGMVAEVDSEGAITVGGQHNSYLLTSNTGYDTSAIATLFAQWNFTNVYTSNNIAIPEDVTVAITETTKLADINPKNYQDGYITVVKDGVQTHISLTADDTVGTLLNELEMYGFQAVVNDGGQVIIKTTGNSTLQNYVGAEQASNILDILGIGVANWVSTNTYDGDALDVNEYTTTTAEATRDTLLSDLVALQAPGTKITGEYYIYKNGVKYTALISSDETVGSFLDTLATYGIEANIVSTGTAAKLEITGAGNTYIEKSVSTTNASDVPSILFPDGNDVTKYAYESDEKLGTAITTNIAATEDTKLTDLDVAWTDNVNKANGQIAVKVDGVENIVNITANDTTGTLMEKFRSLGLEVSLDSDGKIMIQSGYKEFEIDNANSTSNAINDLGITFVNDFGGYVASNQECESTTTTIENRTDSIASWADNATELNKLNVTAGSFTVYRNGLRATVTIEEGDTFTDLQNKINNELQNKGAVNDVVIDFDHGYMKMYSAGDASIEVGSSSDTSNIASICGFSNDGSGTISSARELYKINGQTKLMDSGVFRLGDVTAGAFTIGDEVFYIDDTTTLQGIMSQINASEKANTSAYWDSIEGKIVLTSRSEGSSFINIEAGSSEAGFTGNASNFTDILCLTKTENLGAADQVTRINVENQEVGSNAIFSINGTTYTSTGNVIKSDISKIEGVTINLKGVSQDGATTTLTIEKDKETVANAVSDIVDAYNELIAGVDKEIAQGGTLSDQFSLKLLRNEIRSLMSNTFLNTGVFKNMDSIGISADKAIAGNIDTSRVNVLNFDKNKFLDAFDSDLDSLQTLLVGNEANGYKGVLTSIENAVERALDGGYFTSADKSYDTKIQRLNKKISKAEKDVEVYRARLENKFASMDLLISNIQNQYSSFLS